MSVLGEDCLVSTDVLAWLIGRDEPSFLPSLHTDKSPDPSSQSSGISSLGQDKG
jgi:hypothetical protein